MSLIEVNQAILAWTVLSKSAKLCNQTYGSRVKVADFYKVSSWAEHINFDFA